MKPQLVVYGNIDKNEIDHLQKGIYTLLDGKPNARILNNSFYP